MRGARALVFGAASVLLAVSAHVIAGGQSPSALTLGLIVVPVAWVAAVLTRRKRGALAIAATLGATQLVLHEALMVLADGGQCSAAAGAGAAGHLGMAGHHMVVACSPAAMAHLMQGSSPSMLLAHVVATVATAWVLYRGERTAWALFALLCRLVPVPTGGHQLLAAPPLHRWSPQELSLPAGHRSRPGAARAPPLLASLAAA
jgi:hypothetical protein